MRRFFIIVMVILAFAQNSPAQILYTDYNPDIELHLPPQGGRDSDMVDVDHDGQNDFKFLIVWSFFNLHMGCCWGYDYYIKGLMPLNRISFDSPYNNATCGRLVLDSGYCSGNNYSYDTMGAFLVENSPSNCGPPAIIPKFFPFQMDINGNTCYGWFRILSTNTSLYIYDMAVNLVPDSCIITGQTAVGISELPFLNSLAVYPNPNKGTFILETKRIIPEGEVWINNVLGTTIYHTGLHQFLRKEIILDEIPTGIYFLKLVEGKSQVASKMISIQ